MPLFDQICAELLRCRHLRGPRIAVAELPERRVHGEVGRRDVIEVNLDLQGASA